LRVSQSVARSTGLPNGSSRASKRACTIAADNSLASADGDNSSTPATPLSAFSIV
jgi:hypothetical protein